MFQSPIWNANKPLKVRNTEGHKVLHHQAEPVKDGTCSHPIGMVLIFTQNGLVKSLYQMHGITAEIQITNLCPGVTRLILKFDGNYVNTFPCVVRGINLQKPIRIIHNFLQNSTSLEQYLTILKKLHKW